VIATGSSAPFPGKVTEMKPFVTAEEASKIYDDYRKEVCYFFSSTPLMPRNQRYAWFSSMLLQMPKNSSPATENVL